MNGELLTRIADALDYPGADLDERCRALRGTVEPACTEAAEAVERFRTAVQPLPLARLQEIYASTFDLNPVCCLYVGYHLFGESYKRGAFMAKLNAEYRAAGFDPGNELPDHLPVVLRFLAGLDGPETRRWLLESAVCPAVSKIADGFDETDNVYASLVRSASLALAPPGTSPRPGSRALPVLDRLTPHSEGSSHGKHL